MTIIPLNIEKAARTEVVFDDSASDDAILEGLGYQKGLLILFNSLIARSNALLTGVVN